MKRIVLGTIALLLLTGIASAHEMTIESGHDHGDEKIILTNAEEAPAIKIEVFPDPVSGYNIRLTTQRFTFTPQNAGKEDVMGEGHAHLYVDGTKIARVYGEWFHIPAITGVGTHEVKVTLNGNSHAAYFLGELPIDDKTTVLVESETIPVNETAHDEESVDSTPQSVNQKDLVTSEEAIPLLILGFIALGAFAFAMGAVLGPRTTRSKR